MNDNKKNFEKLLYSGIGIFIVFMIVVFVNFIATALYFRVDCTQDRIYTLSSNTKSILSHLDAPVVIKFYYSRSNSRMPAPLRAYAKRIEDILSEYKYAGKGNVVIEKYDPVPDSGAEEAAGLDGISGQTLNSGDRIYLGLSVTYFDRTISIPFLAPQKESVLEYDIARAITQVSKNEKITVGVLSPVPVLGSMPTAQMLQAGRFIAPQPWYSFKELMADFNVKKLNFDTDKIDDKIKLLIVYHPAGISEKTLFAIDQYLLGGGKLLVFLDPKFLKSNEDDALASQQSSDLPKLLNTWGLKYSQAVVAADMTLARRQKLPDKISTYPSIIDIKNSKDMKPGEGFNKKAPITGQLQVVSTFFPGFFEIVPVPGVSAEVLIATTADSQPVSMMLAERQELILKNFTSSGKPLPIAVILDGKFRTAFPNGAPDAAKNADPKVKSPEQTYLKDSLKASSVVVVGDADMIVNEACVQVSKNAMGQSIMVRANDNISFFQNIVEYLSGDSELMKIRCKQISERPFAVVNRIQSQAEQKFKNKIVDLEKSLIETQNSLNRLQRDKSADQQYVMSPEQQKELKKYRDKESDARKELKTLRKQFRSEIDSLENRLMWFNIAFVPLLVVAGGVIYAIYNRRRHSAK